MKPLTIEQLKALPVGEWVWVKFLDDFLTACWGTGYAQIKDCVEKKEDFLEVYYDDEPGRLAYVEYGKTWLAWKNKEQAECKGEIVELPCIREIDDFIENDGTRVRMKELNYMERGRIYSIPYVEGQFEEAERRLAELTKE